MIDLSMLETKTFDLKLDDKDKTVLNLRKPSNELFKNTFTMIKLIEANSEEEKIIGAIYNFLTKIFNRNLNDKKFSQQEIEELIDVDVAMLIIKEYFKFVQEVAKDINFL